MYPTANYTMKVTWRLHLLVLIFYQYWMASMPIFCKNRDMELNYTICSFFTQNCKIIRIIQKYSTCLHPYPFIITLKTKLKPVTLKRGYAKNMFPDATFGVHIKNTCSIVTNRSSTLHLLFKCTNIVLSMMCTYL